MGQSLTFNNFNPSTSHKIQESYIGIFPIVTKKLSHSLYLFSSEHSKIL